MADQRDPEPFENGNLIEQARAANPNLEIIARAHTDAEVDHLKRFGASIIIMGEREIARGLTEHIERRLAPPGGSGEEQTAVPSARPKGDVAVETRQPRAPCGRSQAYPLSIRLKRDRAQLAQARGQTVSWTLLFKPFLPQLSKA